MRKYIHPSLSFLSQRSNPCSHHPYSDSDSRSSNSSRRKEILQSFHVDGCRGGIVAVGSGSLVANAFIQDHPKVDAGRTLDVSLLPSNKQRHDLHCLTLGCGILTAQRTGNPDQRRLCVLPLGSSRRSRRSHYPSITDTRDRRKLSHGDSRLCSYGRLTAVPVPVVGPYECVCHAHGTLDQFVL